VTARGAALPDAASTPLALPVTVQLVNDANRTCFAAVYDAAAVTRDDARRSEAATR
jgi:hypothetical protein